MATDSPVRKHRTSPSPVTFAGLSDNFEEERTPRRKLPRSPLPPRRVPEAPLADLFADFDGQDTSLVSDDIQNTESALDLQNANTALRCSRHNCKLNSPAQSPCLIQDPLIAPYCLPLCICGAPMTRISLFSYDLSSTQASAALTDISVALPKTADEMNGKTEVKVKVTSVNSLFSRGGPTVFEDRQQKADRSPFHNMNDDYHDPSPTEETKLIKKPK